METLSASHMHNLTLDLPPPLKPTHGFRALPTTLSPVHASHSQHARQSSSTSPVQQAQLDDGTRSHMLNTTAVALARISKPIQTRIQQVCRLDAGTKGASPAFYARVLQAAEVAGQQKPQSPNAHAAAVDAAEDDDGFAAYVQSEVGHARARRHGDLQIEALLPPWCPAANSSQPIPWLVMQDTLFQLAHEAIDNPEAGYLYCSFLDDIVDHLEAQQPSSRPKSGGVSHGWTDTRGAAAAAIVVEDQDHILRVLRSLLSSGDTARPIVAALAAAQDKFEDWHVLLDTVRDVRSYDEDGCFFPMFEMQQSPKHDVKHSRSADIASAQTEEPRDKAQAVPPSSAQRSRVPSASGGGHIRHPSPVRTFDARATVPPPAQTWDFVQPGPRIRRRRIVPTNCSRPIASRFSTPAATPTYRKSPESLEMDSMFSAQVFAAKVQLIHSKGLSGHASPLRHSVATTTPSRQAPVTHPPALPQPAAEPPKKLTVLNLIADTGGDMSNQATVRADRQLRGSKVPTERLQYVAAHRLGLIARSSATRPVTPANDAPAESIDAQPSIVMLTALDTAVPPAGTLKHPKSGRGILNNQMHMPAGRPKSGSAIRAGSAGKHQLPLASPLLYKLQSSQFKC